MKMTDEHRDEDVGQHHVAISSDIEATHINLWPVVMQHREFVTTQTYLRIRRNATLLAAPRAWWPGIEPSLTT